VRRTMMTGLTLIALAVSGAGGARPARAEILCTLKDLGNGAGWAVNDFGQVAGYSGTAGTPLAFLSGPGGGPLQALGTPGGSYSWAYAVNDSGQVAGWADIAGNVQHRGSVEHAFPGRRVPL
jgi:uncharacterized membrane protein